MNEMSSPIMVFRNVLLSSSGITRIFLERMTYHMSINFCRVPPKPRFFKVNKR